MQSKTKDVLYKVTTAVVCILVYCMSSRLENVSYRPAYRPPYRYGPQEDWYGMAAKSISRSSMWSSDKAAALDALLSGAPDGYYQSIIAIVNSSMWSSDRLQAIERESEKFEDEI